MTTPRRPSGDLDTICVNTLRTLAIDAVEKANSGQPGTPMGMAPVGYQLWPRQLRFDPADPIWPNRDRCVLSGGHASMLLYALLHLAQVKAVNPVYETVGRASVTLEVAVPGHRYSLGEVKEAEARSDLDVLAARGRRALRVHLGADVTAGLQQLRAALTEAIGTPSGRQ